jgi:hypothetical protein
MARTPGQTAALDQASAAVAPLGGRIVDTADALMTLVVDAEGVAHFTATTRDLRWIANSLSMLAQAADDRATRAGQ